MIDVLNLMRKDIVVIKNYIWFIIGYCLFFKFTFQGQQGLLIEVLVPSMFVIFVVGNDLKLFYQQFLNSLPVSRKKLVASKYLTSLILILVSQLFVIVTNGLVSIVLNGSWHWDWVSAQLGALMVILFSFVYLPVTYWLGHNGARLINMVMMVIALVASGVLSDLWQKNPNATWIMWANTHQTALVFFILCTLLLFGFISYVLSVSLYSKKDF
jgi:hypothetical protein